MGRNKKWKRRAKRMMGKSDLSMCDCFFCDLSRDVYRYNMNHYDACLGHIRELEQDIKKENIRRFMYGYKK